MDNHYINIRGKLHHFHEPWVMGIVNVTPDSFYNSSRSYCSDAIRQRVDMIMQEGAHVIDIGGYSSRPGAAEVSMEEEYRRLSMGLEVIRKFYPDAIVSIDTFRAEVARRAVIEWNADIVNDISGGDLDPDMWSVVEQLKVPYILMHMRGNPDNMQQLCDYEDVTADVMQDLARKADVLHRMGVCDIILDPGFGFAKDLSQNYQLLAELHHFKQMNMPVLVGVSRKSMIYRLLDITSDEALNGTTVLNTVALLNGADILRVHDVKEAVETVKLVKQLRNSMLNNISSK